MVSDAQKYADSDRKSKERIEMINGAENTVAEIEKSLSQFSDQVPAGEAEKVRTLIAEVRACCQGSETDAEAIKAKVNELNQASLSVFQLAYQKKMQSNNTGNNEDSANDPNPKADEADFKEAK